MAENAVIVWPFLKVGEKTLCTRHWDVEDVSFGPGIHLPVAGLTLESLAVERSEAVFSDLCLLPVTTCKNENVQLLALRDSNFTIVSQSNFDKDLVEVLWKLGLPKLAVQ